MMSTQSYLAALPTPCLIVDQARMTRNIGRLATRARALGVALRPHLKTVKSVAAARAILGAQVAEGQARPMATVSTLAEAEVFAAAGITDIIYAVGISPDKLDRVIALRQSGCDLAVILDSLPQAQAVAEAARRAGHPIPALIEIDCDGHRGGYLPQDPALIDCARLLQDGGAELRGVLTHAGESYNVTGRAAHAAFAAQERDAVVAAAQALRAAGLPCPVVSVGSTPTAHAASDLSGVTELRAGVYVFFDLVMAGIGVCTPDDLALSVLTTVIGHQDAKSWILIDAGWMALSRDRGTQRQAVDQGYGLVCDAAGTIIEGLIVAAANQEHGIITRRPGSAAPLPDLPLGTKLRILPNHACATGAQHREYHVLPADPDAEPVVWSRFGGW
ncbi:alanine racemase [Phaeovulum sp. W22_SRMD_FR3]|uniref:alanine racemase n=1 Tax=Phaeovulum sp. W22_SRMD_FR3 TaxID=3240274 RepID=UPI003F94B484